MTKHGEMKISLEKLSLPQRGELAEIAGVRELTVDDGRRYALDGLRVMQPAATKRAEENLARGGIKTYTGPVVETGHEVPVFPMNPQVVSRPGLMEDRAPAAAMPQDDPQNILAQGSLAHTMFEGSSAFNQRQARMTTEAATGRNGSGRDVSHASVAQTAEYDPSENNVQALNDYVGALEQPDYPSVDMQPVPPQAPYDQAAHVSNAWAAVEQAQNEQAQIQEAA